MKRLALFGAVTGLALFALGCEKSAVEEKVDVIEAEQEKAEDVAEELEDVDKAEAEGEEDVQKEEAEAESAEKEEALDNN